jgi:hypothetical protein
MTHPSRDSRRGRCGAPSGRRERRAGLTITKRNRSRGCVVYRSTHRAFPGGGGASLTRVGRPCSRGWGKTRKFGSPWSDCRSTCGSVCAAMLAAVPRRGRRDAKDGKGDRTLRLRRVTKTRGHALMGGSYPSLYGFPVMGVAQHGLRIASKCHGNTSGRSRRRVTARSIAVIGTPGSVRPERARAAGQQFPSSDGNH